MQLSLSTGIYDMFAKLWQIAMCINGRIAYLPHFQDCLRFLRIGFGKIMVAVTGQHMTILPLYLAAALSASSHRGG